MNCKSKFHIIFLSLFLLNLTSCAQEKNDAFYVASWNVENLYDTSDDPATEDEEFLPGSEKEWTEERFEKKLASIAKVINYMNNGEGPDILGLMEVENKYVLEQLVTKYFNQNKYSILHYESKDGRGIDNALLFRSDLFRLEESDVFEVKLPDGSKTRDILYAALKSNNEEIHIFVNHWPSRSKGLEESEPKRIAAANELKLRTDALLAENSSAQIILMGDFNDETDNKSVSQILGAEYFICNHFSVKQGLFNLASAFDKENMGTYMYKSNWNMLDQIIISNAFLNGTGLEYKCDSFEIIKPEFMVTRSGDFKGAAWPTYGGRRYLGGYSDHFPVGARFILK